MGWRRLLSAVIVVVHHRWAGKQNTKNKNKAGMFLIFCACPPLIHIEDSTKTCGNCRPAHKQDKAGHTEPKPVYTTVVVAVDPANIFDIARVESRVLRGECDVGVGVAHVRQFLKGDYFRLCFLAPIQINTSPPRP